MTLVTDGRSDAGEDASVNEKQPDQKSPMGGTDSAPTEQFAPPPPPAPDPAAAPPPPPMPDAAPPAGWQQPVPPPQPPPAGWQAPQATPPPPSWQQPPQPPPAGGAPTGWVGPQAQGVAPQGQWMPPGGMPAAYVREGGVTGLAKLGSVVLILFGLLFGLAGALLILAAGLIRDALGSQAAEFGDVFVGLAAFFGIVILGLMFLQILAGIFAWRGSGFARFIGVIYGLLLGLLFLAGLSGSTQAPAGDTNSLIPTLVFAIGYLYVAVVFIFRFRSRPS